MANDRIRAAVEAFADEVDGVVWPSLPRGSFAAVTWDGGDVAGYLEAVRRLRPRVIYIAPTSDVVSVAVEGILHTFDPDGVERPAAEMIEFDDRDLDIDIWRDDLPADLHTLAATIAEDPRFDGQRADDLIDELGGHVDVADYQRIWWTARSLFDDGIGGRLQKESRGIVRDLLRHADFDPLFVDFRREEQPFFEAALAGRDARVRELVERGIQAAVWQDGLRDRAERDVKADAADRRRRVPRLILDRVGFATRNNVRDELLAPYLADVPVRRRSLTAYWIKTLDNDETLALREQRYTSAAHALLAQGKTKKAAATQLLLSASTLDRLLASPAAAGFALECTDPILLELAPELAA